MAKARPRLVIIDASIAKAAGDASQHPTSRHCREFLVAFGAGSHKVVMTEPIGAEWDKHQSGYARLWRRSMMSRRRIEPVEVEPHHRRTEQIRKLELAEKQADIMEKDCHLIEAAIASEERITSLDDEVRGLFRTHHRSIPDVGSICWVNPNKADEKAIEWLNDGAPAERHRLLKAPLASPKKK